MAQSSGPGTGIYPDDQYNGCGFETDAVTEIHVSIASKPLGNIFTVRTVIQTSILM